MGGLAGGGGKRRAGDVLSFDLVPSARMVDVEDEDVDDSRTEESPCWWRILTVSLLLLRATGGRLSSGLVCLTRGALLVITTPGEYEDMDVGVEETLNGPGDSEYLVEGVDERA